MERRSSRKRTFRVLETVLSTASATVGLFGLNYMMDWRPIPNRIAKSLLPTAMSWGGRKAIVFGLAPLTMASFGGI